MAIPRLDIGASVGAEDLEDDIPENTLPETDGLIDKLAKLRQDQAASLQEHAIFRQGLNEQQQALQERQGDLDVAGRLMQVFDTALPKPAREYLFRELSTHLGIDPKSETARGIGRMVTALDPDSSAVLKAGFTSRLRDASPGEIQQFAKAVLQGQIPMSQFVNMSVQAGQQAIAQQQASLVHLASAPAAPTDPNAVTPVDSAGQIAPKQAPTNQVASDQREIDPSVAAKLGLPTEQPLTVAEARKLYPNYPDDPKEEQKFFEQWAKMQEGRIKFRGLKERSIELFHGRPEVLDTIKDEGTNKERSSNPAATIMEWSDWITQWNNTIFGRDELDFRGLNTEAQQATGMRIPELPFPGDPVSGPKGTVQEIPQNNLLGRRQQTLTDNERLGEGRTEQSVARQIETLGERATEELMDKIIKENGDKIFIAGDRSSGSRGNFPVSGINLDGPLNRADEINRVRAEVQSTVYEMALAVAAATGLGSGRELTPSDIVKAMKMIGRSTNPEAFERTLHALEARLQGAEEAYVQARLGAIPPPTPTRPVQAPIAAQTPPQDGQTPPAAPNAQTPASAAPAPANPADPNAQQAPSQPPAVDPAQAPPATPPVQQQTPVSPEAPAAQLPVQQEPPAAQTPADPNTLTKQPGETDASFIRRQRKAKEDLERARVEEGRRDLIDNRRRDNERADRSLQLQENNASESRRRWEEEKSIRERHRAEDKLERELNRKRQEAKERQKEIASAFARFAAALGRGGGGGGNIMSGGGGDQDAAAFRMSERPGRQAPGVRGIPLTGFKHAKKKSKSDDE